MTHGCVTATDMCVNSTDCVGVLLLLLQLQFGQTKPIDFICDPETRRRMDVTEALEPLTTRCSDQLPSAVLKPCVRINMAAWKQTSLLIRDTHPSVPAEAGVCSGLSGRSSSLSGGREAQLVLFVSDGRLEDAGAQPEEPPAHRGASGATGETDLHADSRTAL